MEIKENINSTVKECGKPSDKQINFINEMSHNLRTPLTCILGLTQQMISEKLTPKQYKYMDSIYQSACELLTNVDYLLGEIENGRTKNFIG